MAYGVKKLTKSLESHREEVPKNRLISNKVVKEM